ncbi:GTPase IMAP family member 5-like [Pagrus major]|uniref:GTPase IMAP family member 5-like n=1 Tax=Pagrus major TaxID=143350 RepID=UPI003CC8B49A
MDPIPDPGLTIVLLGNSGVGKSASGNTILGRPAFLSKRSFKSVTTQISKNTETVFGKHISVIDSPGIFGSETDIRTCCQELLQSSTPCLFLVVVKIDRFTIEEKNAVDAAVSVIGDQFNNCYLLFTGGDELDDMLDEFISEDPKLRPLVESFEGRHHVFNNKDGGQEQVKKLLEKSGHLRNAADSWESETEEEIRIVLLGLPGGGKSASGNNILGSVRFESVCGFNSVSEETVSKSDTVEGRLVKVVDTPGFTGKGLSPKKLFNEIMKAVAEADPGPHAFIIVLKIDRISAADIKLLKMLPKLFSRDAPKYTMVLFTNGDRLKEKSVNDLIQDNRYVSELVSKCGGRHCVFDNTKTGNRVQVKNLLDKIDQISRANGETYYTSEMFLKVQPLHVKISIKWQKLGEWFIRKLKKIDAHKNEYTRVEMNEMGW